jgi:hypothetical protein
MRPTRLIPAILVGAGVAFLQVQSSAQAAVFDLTSPSSSNTSIKTFLDSGLTLTASNSNSTGTNPGTVNTNSAGLCAFAATGTSGVGRCGYGSANNVGVSSFMMAFDKPVSFNSFDVSDFDAGNLPPNISQGTIGFSLDNVTFTNVSFNGTGTVPIAFQALTPNQPIYIQTSGLFSNSLNTGGFRLNNFNVTEVPGPLPILGAGAAFNMTRKFRRLSARSKA